MRDEHAPLTPSVLRWARETAGYTVEEAAGKLKVKVARVEGWEAGTIPLTFGRLDALAALYKRPLAFFYLSKPPAEEHRQPVDFRAKAPGRMVPGLLYQTRHASERRDVALDLFTEVGEAPPSFAFSCSRDEDPVIVGDRLRRLLGVPFETQYEWRKDANGYTALSAWRQAVESMGVLVFQAPKKDIGEVRGLSIYADVLPAIILRSADVPVARAFTLMHELAHLGLREGGVCDLHDANVELFCNEVSAAVLMPERELRRQAQVAGVKGDWSNSALQKLARSFSVSEPALVLRLVEIGAAPWTLYQAKRREFELRARAAEARKDKEESVIVPPYRKSLASNGQTYARLVLEAYHRGAIPAARAMRYLGVSFDGLGKIELELGNRASRAA